MIVVSRDGFIDWSWGSKPLLRSGVFSSVRQSSVARQLFGFRQSHYSDEGRHQLAEGVWSKSESVFESAVFSEYHGMAISLLIYPDEPPRKWRCG